MLILKDLKLEDIIYHKAWSKIIMSSSMEKTFISINSDIKRYKEIRKLTRGQGEDYATGCLLDYDYIKKHYMLTAVDLSRQKIWCWFKAIQQTEFDN